MKCSYCQADNRAEARFCADCGRKIQNLTPLQRRILLTGLAGFVIVLFARKPVADNHKFSGLLRAGEVAIEQNKLEEAKSLCESALGVKPGNAKAKACVAKAADLLRQKNASRIGILAKNSKQLLAGQKYKEAIQLLREASILGGGAEIENLIGAAEKSQAQREAPEAKARYQARINNMVLIPAGEFQMGSLEGERDEYPRHMVYLDAYYIDKHEVTVGQYKDFAKDAGRAMREQESWSTDRHPIVNVDWHDADAYCKWAGGRLPTEAEWEKAARGGTNTTYSFADDKSKLGEYAWYSGNSNRQAHPVGQKKANQYGLYDMHGNVWEWVSDWYYEDYYRNSPEKNPQGPDSGSLRGLRGGAWLHGNLRAAARYWNFPDYDPTDHYNGFRCVVPAQDSKPKPASQPQDSLSAIKGGWLKEEAGKVQKESEKPAEKTGESEAMSKYNQNGNAGNCKNGTCNWYDAMAYCGGRLPTSGQLRSWYQAECAGGRQGKTCDKWYWSSVSGPGRDVVFANGLVGTDMVNANVRCAP